MKRVLALFVILLLTGCSSLHEHQFSDANYQQPAICTICQKEAGFPLRADFSIYDIVVNMEIGKSYLLDTVCKDDRTVSTSAKVEVVEYISDYQNENYVQKADYQWKRVVIRLSFDDDKVVENGVAINYLTTNYYNIRQFVSTYNYNFDKACYEFTVNYYGVDYSQCQLIISATDVEWQNSEEGYIKEYLL
ncbi:MAG TPA: hypothetical protein PLI19_02830, partial [Erysipelotrichaceae bacterium]|nr:hypothetical protein [Erysipelotrichaceae bacterium]